VVSKSGGSHLPSGVGARRTWLAAVAGAPRHAADAEVAAAATGGNPRGSCRVLCASLPEDGRCLVVV